VGAGAATETELTATSIPARPEVLPGAKHTFINDQLRAGHRAPQRGLWQAIDNAEHTLALLIEVVDQASESQQPGLR
jgi:hypothetical protein